MDGMLQTVHLQQEQVSGIRMVLVLELLHTQTLLWKHYAIVTIQWWRENCVLPGQWCFQNEDPECVDTFGTCGIFLWNPPCVQVLVIPFDGPCVFFSEGCFPRLKG